MYVYVHVVYMHGTCMCEHVHVDVCTCVLSVCSVRFCAWHCVSIDFVCMHLLLDQFFDDFLKLPKLKQLLICCM